MKSLVILIIIFPVILFSCSNKYKAFKSQYSFKSDTGEPDYKNLNYWAAHPWKHDPSDSIPKPLRSEIRDSVVDVFFLYPTSYTRKIKMNTPNAAIDNSFINAKTDYTSILYQASVFNQQSRVFAPRYRQAHIKIFFIKDKEKADSAFALAYKDLKTAFEYYMHHWNNGRPIIIASHSQGSKMAEQLLKEFFEDKPLKEQLVVAYLPGWPVPKDYFSSLKMCTDSLQTGCICSWRTLRKGYIPYYLRNENGNSFVTNPLTWTTGSEYASRKMNKGSVLTKFNKIYKHTTDAQISNGLLYVKKPKFPWSFLFFSRNYHVGDINLFYINIRENVRQRTRVFLNK
ncbi:MAG: DUF3089 domain-containing protein [Bacteroidia bacterium]|nr:DUF3089 domain-containing protein [Bacteroidia bacterium]